jgi:broad-specificity NMP kinase
LKISSNQTLLVINGPAGVGKSTIASLLVKKRKGSALVRGDQLKDFVIDKPDDDRASRVTYRNGAAVCSELLESGFRFVVFDFIFNDLDARNDFLTRVQPAVSFVTVFVTLWASQHVVLNRRRSRIEEDRYVHLMEESWNQISSQLSELGEDIDTNDRTPEQVCSSIEELIKLEHTLQQGVALVT